MYSQFEDVIVRGVATVLPVNEIDNEKFAEYFGAETVKKQMRLTGITKRRTVSEGQTALDLAVSAGEKVLAHANWLANEVDVLVFASGYRKYNIPSSSVIAHHLLKGKRDCLCFDINLACTGTVDGLYTVVSLLKQLNRKAKGLLLIGETPTLGGDDEDKSISMLPCDCGSAMAIEIDDDGKMMRFGQMTDGNKYHILTRKSKESSIFMDGMEVFQFAITDAVNKMKEFLEHFSVDIDSIDCFITHQAQKFIVDKVSLFAGFPKDKVFRSYHLFGNTGGSSDICTLCVNRKELHNGERCIFMTGFGAGVSCGIVLFKMNTTDILPIEYSEQIWGD